MRESTFQIEVCRDLREILPGCIILKNDAELLQGFPDLLVLYSDKWAALEVKGSATASHQPNQDYYVEKLEEMSFGAFIFPENKDAIIGELRRFFRPRKLRAARVV